MNSSQNGCVVFYSHTSKEQERIYNLMRVAKYGDMICDNLIGCKNDFTATLIETLLNSATSLADIDYRYFQKHLPVLCSEYTTGVVSESLDVFYTIAEDNASHEIKWQPTDNTLLQPPIQEDLVNDHLRMLISQYDEWDTHYGTQSLTLETACTQAMDLFSRHYAVPVLTKLTQTTSFQINKDRLSVSFLNPYTFELIW